VRLSTYLYNFYIINLKLMNQEYRELIVSKLISEDRGLFIELKIEKLPLGKVMYLNDKCLISIDVVDSWSYQVDKEVSLGSHKLIYHFDKLNNMTIELIGYENPEKRELISVRIYTVKLDIEKLREIIIDVLSRYSPKWLYKIVNYVKKCESQ